MRRIALPCAVALGCFAGAVLIFFAPAASAQWTWISLHPSGALSSEALSTTASQQAGMADGHASI